MLQCFGQRVLGIEVGEAQARAQVLLGIGRQLVAAFGDRLADADGRHRVLQRLARAHVHDDVAGRDDRHAVPRGNVLDGAAVDVVHRALHAGSGRPSASRETSAFIHSSCAASASSFAGKSGIRIARQSGMPRRCA